MRNRKTDDEMAMRIRHMRRERGMSTRQLSMDLLGKEYPSYIFLIESGKKIPSVEEARKLARLLGDDEDLYAAWAEAHEGQSIDTIVQSARRYEALRRNPNLRVEVIGRDEVSIEPSASAGAEARAEFDPVVAPFADEEFLHIPVIPEGEDPGDGPRPVCEILDFLRLAASRVPEEERLVRPFAYRLSRTGVRRVQDVLRAGDCVVVTRDGKPPDRKEIYAVRRGRRVHLSRVLLRHDALLLLSSRGEEDIEVVRLPAPGDFGRAIVGRVAIAIRPWQFTLFSPRQAISDRQD